MFLFLNGKIAYSDRESMEYRCDDHGVWHFFNSCPLWPEDSLNIIISETLPPDFQVCETCIAREGKPRKPTQTRGGPANENNYR